MSFAGDSGLDPRRPGTFESEGSFHLSNESGDLRLYWKNALEHLKSFWASGAGAVGLQEMNLTAPGASTGSAIVDFELKGINGNTETDTLQCMGGAKPSMTIAWRKDIFGPKKDSKIYDLDYMHVEEIVVAKAKPQSLKQAGRPMQILLTDKNCLLINIHAPNQEFASEGEYSDFKKGFQDTLNKFIAEVPDAATVPLDRVVVMGDFNDRYDSLQELPITIGANSGILRYSGQAPLSCCHNWDSSCSADRFVSKGLTGRGRERAGTCKIPTYPAGTKVGDTDFEGKPYVLAGLSTVLGPRVKMGEEGTIANYRYTGDKIFVLAPASNLTIVPPANGEASSTRSDHEMVQMAMKVPADMAGGRRRNNKKQNKKTQKKNNKKNNKRNNKSRKH